MMYSVLEIFDVFEGWENFQLKYETVELTDGVKVYVQPLNDQEVRIVQLISSNPMDYMNKDLSPGKILKYKLQLE